MQIVTEDIYEGFLNTFSLFGVAAYIILPILSEHRGKNIEG